MFWVFGGVLIFREKDGGIFRFSQTTSLIWSDKKKLKSLREKDERYLKHIRYVFFVDGHKRLL